MKDALSRLLPTLTLSLMPAAAWAEVKPPPPIIPERLLTDAPTRPVVTRTAELDYESLPMMHETRLAPTSEFSYVVQPTPMDPNTTPAPPSWSVRFANPSSVLRLEGRDLPTEQEIGLPPRPGSSEWFVLARSGTTATTVALRRFVGAFDGHQAVASSVETVDALAILPGVAYAYRRCVAGCERTIDDPARSEVLGLVGPPAVWSASSDGRAQVPRGDPRSFTSISAELHPGSSAMLGLVMMKDRARAILPGAKWPGGDALSVEIDVVWEEGAAPAVLVSTGTMSGAANALGPEGWPRYR